MPRYFFDFHDSEEGIYLDTIGTDLDNDEMARLEATRTLLEIARDSPPRSGSLRELKLVVRSDSGDIVWESRLSSETLRGPGR